MMNIKCFDRGFSPGSIVVVNGIVCEDADRFEINLQCGPEVPPEVVYEIALHFNPRFDDNESVMVRNTLRNGFWGSEEREGGFFFTQNKEYSITIHAEWKGYKIVVDDFPFIYYKHRIDLSTVTHMSVAGDFQVKDLCYFPAPQLEERFYVPKPTVPFRYILPHNFKPGCTLVVKGKIRGDVERFSVNLVCGKSPAPDHESLPPTSVALHYDVRFFNNTIVVNSILEGEWNEEKEVEEEFLYCRENEFTLLINCADEHFEVIVNNISTVKYKHKTDICNISYVYISGGIYLDSIDLITH